MLTAQVDSKPHSAKVVQCDADGVKLLRFRYVQMLKKLHPESADKSENRDVVNGNSVICRLRYS